MARTCQTEKFSQAARTQILKISQTARLSQNEKFSQATKTLNLKALSKTDCVSSGDRNMAYNVSQIHAGREFPDELPTKYCF